jgi:hypothetical protein
MRRGWLAIALLACGGPSKSSSNPPTPNGPVQEASEAPPNDNRDRCARGDTIDCIMYAKQQKEPAKAKQILVDACHTKLDVEGNRPESACRALFEQKLITQSSEAADLCRKTSLACDAVVMSNLLSEEEVWQLCTETLPACNLAQVTTDPEHKAEVEFLSTLFVIRRQITDAASGKVKDDGATVAKGPKAKLPKLNHPACDAVVDAVHNAPRCSRSASLLPELQVNATFLSMPWKAIPAPRRTALAAHCTEVAKDLPQLLAQLCK